MSPPAIATDLAKVECKWARLHLDNERLALEARRLQARLAAKPPLLDKDPPVPAQVDVRVARSGTGKDDASG